MRKLRRLPSLATLVEETGANVSDSPLLKDILCLNESFDKLVSSYVTQNASIPILQQNASMSQLAIRRYIDVLLLTGALRPNEAEKKPNKKGVVYFENKTLKAGIRHINGAHH